MAFFQALQRRKMFLWLSVRDLLAKLKNSPALCSLLLTRYLGKYESHQVLPLESRLSTSRTDLGMKLLSSCLLAAANDLFLLSLKNTSPLIASQHAP